MSSFPFALDPCEVAVDRDAQPSQKGLFNMHITVGRLCNTWMTSWGELEHMQDAGDYYSM